MIPSRQVIKGVRGRIHNAYRPVNQQRFWSQSAQNASASDDSRKQSLRGPQDSAGVSASIQQRVKTENNWNNNNRVRDLIDTTPISNSLQVNRLKKCINAKNIAAAIDAYQEVRCIPGGSMVWTDQTIFVIQDYLKLLVRSNGSVDNYKIQSCVDEAFNDIVKHYPLSDQSRHNASLFSMLIHYYVTMGRYQKALQVKNMMQMRGIQDNVESFVSMIVCYHKLGDYEQCIKAYQMAQRKCRDLNYSRHLADRTMMRVYASMGDYSESRRIRDRLLNGCSQAGGQQSQLDRNSVVLSYLDACADGKNMEEFDQCVNSLLLAGDQNIDHQDSKVTNHLIINYGKLNRFQDAISHIKQSMKMPGSNTASPFLVQDISGINTFGLQNLSIGVGVLTQRSLKNSQSHPRTMDDVLRIAKSYAEQQVHPSTYSDLLFELAKTQNLPDSKRCHFVDQIFNCYKVSILQRYDQLLERAISMAAIQNLAFAKVVGFHQLRVPTAELYNTMVRNQSVFIAAATIYHQTGQSDKAFEVLQTGASHRKFKPSQLCHVFGSNYASITSLSELIE
ncbi:hypothetical protein MP228_012282 [Amoeboaphelidium protococcarum]|nr:hypothetical protein MP228_012282 [Amoeboaphelidium protococcarum]